MNQVDGIIRIPCLLVVSQNTPVQQVQQTVYMTQDPATELW
jgi:hypothetical protein